ncbi:MAG: hypothetical protein KDA60_09735 [Planctomycetales bacterium]|nr:hypothetical protein [Planctomycetales bacterium]
MNQPTIVGLGEALFDVFDEGEHLGGAPLNCAVHAGQLGNDAIVVSRVGDDQRGRQVFAGLERRGISSHYVQIDGERPTGIVQVTMEAGEPNYEIVLGSAWDHLEFTSALAELAERCDAVCFGSLGQRELMSRTAIQHFLSAAGQAIRLFDVNLRQQYFSPELIAASLQLSTAVKLNADELDVLGHMWGEPTKHTAGDNVDRCRTLLARFQLDFVALTRGADGLVVVTPEKVWDGSPVVADTSQGTPVGAGDSSAAAVLHGLTHGWNWPRIVKLANTIGAHVASRPEACPPLSAGVQRLLNDDSLHG